VKANTPRRPLASTALWLQWEARLIALLADTDNVAVVPSIAAKQV
jgi:hypothetical protein